MALDFFNSKSESKKKMEQNCSGIFWRAQQKYSEINLENKCEKQLQERKRKIVDIRARWKDLPYQY